MPRAPKRPCRHPGCKNLADGPYCERHRSDGRVPRASAAARGYDVRWRKARLKYLREHPLCALCRREGRLRPATVVDHIVPHQGDADVFWTESNWQALCKPCHDKKTAAVDGGFGNPRRR